MPENGIVYLTRNTLTGKIYIGITTKNPKGYLGSGEYIKKAIKKYGKENFTRITIDEFDSIEEGCSKERFWIRELNSKHPNGYNLCDGGLGPFNMCQESRDKISVANSGPRNGMFGRCHTEEEKYKIGSYSRGKKFGPLSEETKDKLAATKMGNKNALGHKVSEEAKKRMVEGKKLAAEKRRTLNNEN